MTDLNIQNLSLTLPDKQLVQKVSFSLQPGETIGIVGESGAGKSLLAHAIMNLLPSYITRKADKIQFGSEDLLLFNDAQWQQWRGQRFSMIFQEPMTALNPLHTIERQIAESILVHNPLAKNIRKRVLNMMNRVGIKNASKRMHDYPHQFSGGQRQRIMIAMALVNHPSVLIADEPTTALDVTTQQQILDLLNDLQKELNISIILISHDLFVVRSLSDRILVMKDGKVLENQLTNDLFNTPKHAYTKMLLKKSNLIPPALPQDAPMCLQTHNLTVQFPIRTGLLRRITDYNTILNQTHLQVRQGETLGIVGESGSGKSTLAMAILRLIESTGSIEFKGRRIDSIRQKELRPVRKEIQIVFQDPYASLDPKMTIEEIILEGLELHFKKDHSTQVALMHQALKSVDLDPDCLKRFPHEFSGGQRQRIAIARVLALKPSLVILDEPTSALDRQNQDNIINLLHSLQTEYGLTYLFISHDWQVVQSLCHQILVLKDGQTVEYGAIESIVKNPKHPYTLELLKASEVF